jgi:hypothetical protein
MKNSDTKTIRRLLELEGVISRGRRSFLEVGEAFMEIRDKHLYPESYATFIEYCQKRWRFQERTGTQAPKIPRSSLSTDAANAYHEAGHAVAAWCLGVRVCGATIIPDDDSSSHVKLGREKTRTCIALLWGDRWHPSRFRAEKRVMTLQAGEVSQRRYNSRSVRRYHSRRDLNQSLDILLQYSPYEEEPDVTHHYQMLHKWTEALIEQHWHLVEAVAKALLEHRKLSGNQLRDVIRTAQRKQA